MLEYKITFIMARTKVDGVLYGPPRPSTVQRRSGVKNLAKLPGMSVRKKKREESYRVYIAKILKAINEETSMEDASAKIFNSLLYELFRRIAEQAARFIRTSNRITFTSKEILSATNIFMSPKRFEHVNNAVAEKLNLYRDIETDQ